MKRPTFFISSTIHDFKDLRSAIKFYLEEQGCKVLASEFNDFEKPLDRHSNDACLESIQAADYFILLIGTRVGGWYDERNRISITQREYREAYKLHSSKKLRLLNFVRSEVWQVKQDRLELTKFLGTTNLHEPVRTSIANHPSKFAEDANFLIDFINEVGRNGETKRAVEGKGAPPSGNWIHSISGFRDIVDVLQGQIFSSVPIDDMTNRRLLRRELRDIVGKCLLKHGGEVISPQFFIEKFHEEHPITLRSKRDEFTRVSAKRWDGISLVSFHLLSRQFHSVVIQQVLARPTFLEFDVQTATYRETPVYEALLRLQNEIRRFNSCNTAENLTVIFKHSPINRRDKADDIDIDTVQLGGLLHLLDRWVNILALSKSIMKCLDGATFELPLLRPDTPIQGMQTQLDDENPNEQDIESFIET